MSLWTHLVTRRFSRHFQFLFLPLLPALFLGLLESTAWAGSKGRGMISEGSQFPTETSAPQPQTTPSYLTSRIYFDPTGVGYPRFAPISTTDPLDKCPIESLPIELNQLVTQLIAKVKDSVDKMKGLHGDRCTALTTHLNNSETQLNSAMSNQFLAGTSASGTPPPANQDLINAQTQRAGATNELLLTVSDLVQADCISSIDDRVVIQRLVGQVMTLGGLFWGGWQGIATAIGGQLLGNIPIFKDELDAVSRVLKIYDENTERGTFLCLYRQMQKTSCTLFAKPTDTVIEGFDLSLNSGPAHITLNSIEDYKKTFPADYHDVLVLYSIRQSFSTFLSLMKSDQALKNGSAPAWDEFKQACQKASPTDLENKAVHPNHLMEDLSEVIRACKTTQNFNQTYADAKDFALTQNRLFYSLDALSGYYEKIKSAGLDGKPIQPGFIPPNVSKIAQTYESQVYFQNLKIQFERYQGLAAGNQTRINYLKLTEDLGEKLAQKSFQTLMKENAEAFKHSSQSRDSLSISVRKRALTAMLDLCQTLDPTLACLHVGDPSRLKLHRRWMSHCVGPKSMLCHQVLKPARPGDGPSQEQLLTDPGYRNYFESLCGLTSESNPIRPLLN